MSPEVINKLTLKRASNNVTMFISGHELVQYITTFKAKVVDHCKPYLTFIGRNDIVIVFRDFIVLVRVVNALTVHLQEARRVIGGQADTFWTQQLYFNH